MLQSSIISHTEPSQLEMKSAFQELHLSDSCECEGLPAGLSLSVLFRCLYRSGLCTSLPVGFITFSTPGSSVRRLKLKARCQLSASFVALTPPTPRPKTQYPCKVANKDKRELCKTIITSLCCQDVWICVETQGQEESITLLLHVGSPTTSLPPPPLPLNSLSGVLTRRVSQLLRGFSDVSLALCRAHFSLKRHQISSSSG